jgi:hypothetical protein
MDWKSLRPEYSELGRTMIVARPALVMEFYGEGARMIPHGPRLFDHLLGLVPKDAQLHVFGSNSREYKKITPQSLRRIQKTLEELDKKGRFYSFKDAPGFDVGDYSFELTLGSKHDSIADNVQLAFPIEWGGPGQAAQTAEIFSSLVGEFPFWAGVAGYGFDLVWGREFEQRGMPANFAAAWQFHGLLVRDRTQETYLVRKLKSAGWLTYLDAELVELVGGNDALTDAVGDKVQISPVGRGLLLRTGPTPPIGDVNRQAEDLAPLAAVSRAIKPIRLERWLDTNLFLVERETADAWLQRFD